jgi:DNA-binding GntR family transcriptional regulator
MFRKKTWRTVPEPGVNCCRKPRAAQNVPFQTSTDTHECRRLASLAAGSGTDLPARRPPMAIADVCRTVHSSGMAPVAPPAATETRSADRVYARVKTMAVTFHFHPGERINEVGLARRLGTSRTPLREALNRLASEGFLTAVANRGFHARRLEPGPLLDLYEYRGLVESGAVRLACERASAEGIADLLAFAARGVAAEGEDPHALRQLRFDEEFHERVAALSGNGELLRSVRALNERIRFVRWVGLRKGVQAALPEGHAAILDGLQRRDATAAVALMQAHIAARRAQIGALIGDAYAAIHTGNALAAQLVEAAE